MANEKKKLTQDTYLEALVGQPVKIAFLDGKVMKAVYVTTDRYNLFVKAGDAVYMVCKHAIKWVCPDQED
jgi:sRNA-binding regulator protein Hfq